jgi:hypothetical protein
MQQPFMAYKNETDEFGTGNMTIKNAIAISPKF